MEARVDNDAEQYHDTESESYDADDGDEAVASEDSGVQLGSTSQQARDGLGEMSRKHQAKGDADVERQQWDKAVQEFTVALKYAQGSQEEAALLVKRSNALARFAKHLLSIPARVSERRAVYAHDPSVLAQLSLKDATRASKLKPGWPEASAAEGQALMLLERHSDAESAFLEGLALDPANKNLVESLAAAQESLAQQEQEQQQLLADVRRASMDAPTAAATGAAAAAGNMTTDGTDAASTKEAATTRPGAATTATATGAAGGGGAGCSRGAGSSSPGRRARSESLEGAATAAAGLAGGSAGTAAKRQRCSLAVVPGEDDCDCILCLKLLYEPVTTPCGHTFCKACFARSMDHGNRCPMCRTVLHVGRELPVTITLQNILSKAFPEEYSSRAQETAALAAAAAAAAGSSSRVTLPLFVMSTLLPGEKMALNIFEPRYRLMVRRVMEGNRRFGMAQTGNTGPDGLDELAIEAEILECNPLPDGRYYLEMVGRRRLKITQSWELDGYRVASADVIRDQDGPAPAAAAAAAAPGSSDDGAAEGNVPAEASAAAEGGRTPQQQQQQQQSAAELAGEVLASCDVLMQRMRSVLSSRRVGAGHIRDLFDRLGDKPAASNPEAVSWWASRLLLLLLPSSAETWMRRELLAETSTAARLRRLQERLGALANSEVSAGSCSIM